jgi:hypothetical protein
VEVEMMVEDSKEQEILGQLIKGEALKKFYGACACKVTQIMDSGDTRVKN